MKKLFALGLSLCVATAATSGSANPYGVPSSLPYTGTPYAAGGHGYQQTGHPPRHYGVAYAPEEERIDPGYEASPSDLDPAPIYRPEAYSNGRFADPYANGGFGHGKFSNGGCADGSCGLPGFGACRQPCAWGNSGCGSWFGRAAALYMTHTNTDRVWFSAEGANQANQLLNNRDAELGWRWGWEVSLGRCITDCTAIEFTYWQLENARSYANVIDPNDDLLTLYDFGNVEFDGTGAGIYFDGSGEHRLWRYSDIRNLELNLWHKPFCRQACGAPCGKFRFDVLAGVRYFNYDNGFLFGGVRSPFAFGDNGGAEEAYLGIDIENHLIGLQLGADMAWNASRHVSLYARPKAGLYANYIDKQTRVYRGDGVWGESVTGDTFPINGNKTDLAFILEIEAGLRWQMTRCWSAYAGYRAVAVTGVAHADHNIPFYIADTHDFADVHSKGSLVVHGAVFGLEYNW